MASMTEDPSSTLETFILDSANLPAEISYMLEEMGALDTKQSQSLHQIQVKESAIQKQIKNHGSLVPHPREQEYTEYAKRHWPQILDHQDKKIEFADGALKVLDVQLKRLDIHLRSLIADGQLSNDPPLPSIFNRPTTANGTATTFDTSRTPLTQNQNAYNNSAYRSNISAGVPLIKPPQPKLNLTHDSRRGSLPHLPQSSSNLSISHSQTTRDLSEGLDSKRRKLNISTANLPASLRQASADPTARSGTPKAGTPTGGTSSRAGSVGAPASAVGRPRGSTNKKGPTHAAVSKLKAKNKIHVRLSQSRKKAGSPSVRGARASTAASEDSVLSSAAEDSGNDSSISHSHSQQTPSATGPTRGRRRKNLASTTTDPSSATYAAGTSGSQVSGDARIKREEGNENEDDADDADDNLYCYCNQRSFGEMVACENDDCPHQWFHIGCLNLKSVPSEDKWYCPECRGKAGVASNSTGGGVGKGRKRERK